MKLQRSSENFPARQPRLGCSAGVLTRAFDVKFVHAMRQEDRVRARIGTPLRARVGTPALQLLEHSNLGDQRFTRPLHDLNSRNRVYR